MTEHRHFSFNCRRTKEEGNRYLLLLRNCFLYAVFTLTRQAEKEPLPLAGDTKNMKKGHLSILTRQTYFYSLKIIEN